MPRHKKGVIDKLNFSVDSMAEIHHLITNMGNGAAFCSYCGKKLTENPSAKLPPSCPFCNEEFNNEHIYEYCYGGSDF